MFAIFFAPIANALIACYKLLIYLHVPYTLGFAIILLTAAIRLLMYPIIASQIKQAYKMQKMNPHLAAIREKHKNDKKKQQEEMMKLYKEHGVNPASGCLTAIVQLFVFSSLYTVLIQFATASTASAITKINNTLYSKSLFIDPKRGLDTSFFGLSVSNSPSKLITQNHMYLIILSRMMMPEVPPPKTKDGKEDFATTLQSQSLLIFPLMIGLFAFSLPIGMSFYWNTFTIFGILQQYLLVGWGGLMPYLEKLNIKK